MESPGYGNKLSIHPLKYAVTHRKAWNSYAVRDKGKSVYPGVAGEWKFTILGLGGKKLFSTLDLNLVFLFFANTRNLCIAFGVAYCHICHFILSL